MIADVQIVFDPIVTSYSRGDGRWFAQLYDRATAQFYAGTGPTAWSAIAWACDEYLTRGVLKIHRIARNMNERPGDVYRAEIVKAVADDIVKEYTFATPSPEHTLWFDENGPSNAPARNFADEITAATAAREPTKRTRKGR